MTEEYARAKYYGESIDDPRPDERELEPEDAERCEECTAPVDETERLICEACGAVLCGSMRCASPHIPHMLAIEED